MTKQQLIDKVAAKTELKKTEVEAAVDSVFEVISEALRSNERVDLRGFGSFVVKDREGILVPLVRGEFVKDNDQRWGYNRLASVATTPIGYQ